LSICLKRLWISVYFGAFWLAYEIFHNSQCRGQRIDGLESFRVSVGTEIILVDQVKALFFRFVYDNVFPQSALLIYQLGPKDQRGSRFLDARYTVCCPSGFHSPLPSVCSHDLTQVFVKHQLSI